MKDKFAKLIDVKSIVTLLMTLALVVLLFANIEINKELLMLFSTSYGAVITYFFTKNNRKEDILDEKQDTTNSSK